MQALVRNRELHCRRGWGDDRWAMVSEDVVLEVRVRAPERLAPLDERSGEQRADRRSTLQTAEAIVIAWDAALSNESNADRQA